MLPTPLPAAALSACSVPSVPPVLLVSDIHVLRRLKRLLLEWAGYTVVGEILDGRAALAYLRASATPLVVVLCTRIPLLDATGLLQVVAAEPALQRHGFVLTTALARQLPRELVLLTRQLQVPVVGKPFTEEELLTAVASQVHRLHQAALPLPSVLPTLPTPPLQDHHISA